MQIRHQQPSIGITYRAQTAGRLPVARCIFLMVVAASASSAHAIESQAIVPVASDSTRAAKALRGLIGLLPVSSSDVSGAAEDGLGLLHVGVPMDSVKADRGLTRMIEAFGLRSFEVSAVLEGNSLQFLAVLDAEDGAPELPLTRTLIAPQPLTKGLSACAAGCIDPRRAMEWLLEIVRRVDPATGQFLKDGLVVLKWNLSLDVKADVLEAFEGRLYAVAEERAGRLSAFVVAPLSKGAALESTLDRIALGTSLVAGKVPSLVPTSRGRDKTYALKWSGFTGGAALAVRGPQALAYVSEQDRGSEWLNMASRVACRGEDAAMPMDGPAMRSLVVRVDCAQAANHLVRLLKAINVNTGIDALTTVMSEAGGTVTFALRADGPDLVAWGEWNFGPPSSEGRGE